VSDFVPLEKPTSFRRIAAAMWQKANDPTIYGALDLDATALLAFLERYRESRGVKLTPTHVVARALALALRDMPEINAKVRFWGKLERRTTVDLFLQVSAEGGRDLAGARIERADEKSIGDFADELRKRADRIRKGSDASYEQSRGMFRSLPWWLGRLVLRISGFLVNELHIDLSSRGMPSDPFGSAMITSVGMFGIDTAFAPLPPIARAPILILLPEIRRRPWVVGDAVVPRPVLRLCATFDHRVVDGYQAGRLARRMEELLSNPELLDATPEIAASDPAAPAADA